MTKKISEMNGLELFDYLVNNKQHICYCNYLTESRSILDNNKRYVTVLVSLDLDKLEDDNEINFLTDKQKQMLIKKFHTYMQNNIPFHGSGDVIITMKKFLEEL